jgi:hypothetical protein
MHCRVSAGPWLDDFTSTRPTQSRTTIAVNSWPSSLWMCSGTLRLTDGPTATPARRRPAFLAASMARYSRLSSSTTVSIRTAQPSHVRACTRWQFQTWSLHSRPGADARPIVQPKRPASAAAAAPLVHAPPEPLHSFVAVEGKLFGPQQGRDPPVAVPALQAALRLDRWQQTTTTEPMACERKDWACATRDRSFADSSGAAFDTQRCL